MAHCFSRAYIMTVTHEDRTQRTHTHTYTFVRACTHIHPHAHARQRNMKSMHTTRAREHAPTCTPTPHVTTICDQSNYPGQIIPGKPFCKKSAVTHDIVHNWNYYKRYGVSISHFEPNIQLATMPKQRLTMIVNKSLLQRPSKRTGHNLIHARRLLNQTFPSQISSPQNNVGGQAYLIDDGMW